MMTGTQPASIANDSLHGTRQSVRSERSEAGRPAPRARSSGGHGSGRSASMRGQRASHRHASLSRAGGACALLMKLGRTGCRSPRRSERDRSANASPARTPSACPWGSGRSAHVARDAQRRGRAAPGHNSAASPRDAAGRHRPSCGLACSSELQRRTAHSSTRLVARLRGRRDRNVLPRWAAR